MSSTTDFGNISFDLPKNQSNVIKVIGVGGGGSNAINHMFRQGIKGVDFVICNTDAQALQNSPVPNKIQLGVSLTEGLGAGANPEVGEQSAIESLEEIKNMLDSNTKMVFITAGMGGGTGTGAAPIIAKMAKDMDVLTVGIVTMPFQFEGKMRNEQAQKGIENLRRHVDSLIVINNNKLREVYGNLGFKAGFSKADEVLSTASRGIAEVITHHYTQNIDLRDAKTVLSNSGTAIMGSASAHGENRAQVAIMNALDSPLLNDNKITGAKNVLLLIVSGTSGITLDEIGEINDHIQNEAGFGANIIMGVGEDETLGDAVAVTVIATGFNAEQQHEIVNTEAKKIIHTLEEEQRATQDLSPKSSFGTLPFPEEKKVVGQSTTSLETPRPSNTPEAVLPIKEQVVVHTLVEEDDDVKSLIDLVPTTEIIKNLPVVFEEVTVLPEVEDDFVIIDTTARIKDIEVVEPKFVQAEPDLFQLSFDMPLVDHVQDDTEKAPVVTFTLDETVNNYEVNDAIEVVPVTEASHEGEKRYSLDDYMDFENNLSQAKAKSVVAAKVVEEEVSFEKKVVSETETQSVIKEECNPFNSSIEEGLKSRVADRRLKLKEFNYKFKNNSTQKIDEIEREPAYKRMGIELDQQSPQSNTSRMSVGTDSNDELQLRSNNSFLHDNVD